MLIQKSINKDSVYIVPITDTHTGADEFEEKVLSSYAKWIEEHNTAYSLILGDLIENQIDGSKSDRFQKMSPRESIEYSIETLRPIKGRILGMLPGNHEWRSERATGMNPAMFIANALGIPYSKDVLEVNFKVGKVDYKMIGIHGTGAGVTIGAAANKLSKLADVYSDADVYLAGHTHKLGAFMQGTMVDGTVKKRSFVMCGCALGYSAYAAQGGYNPSWSGFARIRLDGKRRDVHVSL